MSKSLRKSFIFIILTALIASAALAVPLAKQAQKAAAPKLPGVLWANVKLLEDQGDALVIEWQCPKILVSRDEATGAVTSIDMAGAETVHEVGVPQLPVLAQLLDCYPGQVTASIVDADVVTEKLGAMLPTPPDVPVDLPTGEDEERDRPLDEQRQLSYAERQAATPLRPGVWPDNVLVVRDAGVYRGHRLVSVQLFPVQVNTDLGTARIIRRARIRITVPRDAHADARRLDAPHETELVRGMLGALQSTAIPSRMSEAFEEHGRDQPLDDEPIGGRWKLLVNTEGIVRVDRALLDSVGVPVDQISTFDTHLFNKGQEIPIYFSGEADGHFDDVDYIDFYGIPNRQTFQAQNPAAYSDPWTDKNVYWLSWGDGQPGLRMGQMTVGWHPEWPNDQIRTLTSVKNKVHAELDQKHDRLAQAAEEQRAIMEVSGPLGVHEDHWFWGSRIDGLTTRNFPISLPFPNTRSFRSVKVRAALHGFSYYPYGGHRAIVFLNGMTAPGLAVGKISSNDPNNVDWRNQTPIVFETTTDTVGITTDQLVDGPNTISVTLPGDGLAGANDKAYANWFEVEYDREMRASRGFITFDFDTTRNDTFALDIRGFGYSNIELWDLAGNVRLFGADVRRVYPADESASYAVRFHLLTTRNHRFHFFDNQHPARPAEVLPEVSTQDLRSQTGAQYVMIYHDSFLQDDIGMASLARLDSLRHASFNGSALAVPLDAVYEQFNHGLVSPYAIRNFLKFAYDHWPVRPTHVCLIGDGILLTKGYRGTGDMIPPFYAQTFGRAIGICAADMLFGCVSGPEWDLIPDVSVGRISARSGAELQTYVDKILAYESVSDFTGLFRSMVMFVSDQRDQQFNFDLGFSEPVLRVLDDTVNVWRVYLDSIPSGQGPNVLRDAFRNPGAVIVNYNGHGGGGVWSNSNLMNVGDVRLLRNRRGFPFITNFTCFVGAFDDRSQTAVLGEAFIFSRNNDGDLVGGIGVYSSTGVGWAVTGVRMQQFLFDFIAERPGQTLGDIVNLSKTRFWAANTRLNPRWASGGGLDVPYSQLVMMNLLGDPGVRLSLPQSSFPALSADTNLVTNGDSIHVSFTLPWTPSSSSPTDVFVLPYNGDLFRYIPRWDSIAHDTVYFPQFRTSKVAAFDQNEVFATPTINVENTLPLWIGPRFVTPDGNVIVFAVDREQQRDAIGAIPIYLADSLTGTRVYRVDVEPDGFIYTDSTFHIRARINHPNGIQQVRMRGLFRPAQGPIVLDTLELTQIQPGMWQSGLVGPHHTFGGAYQVNFYVQPVGEDIQATESFPIPVEQYTDFLVDPNALVQPGLRAGDHSYFYLPVTHRRYIRQRPIPSVDVRLVGVSDSMVIVGPDTTYVVVDSFATDTTAEIPDLVTSLTEVLIPVTLRPRAYRFTATLDPDNRIVETNETNNVSQLSVVLPQIYSASNALGTYYLRPPEPHAFHVHYAVGDTLWLRATPESLPGTTAAFAYTGPVSLSSSEQIRLASQSLFPPITNRAVRVFHVMLGDSTEALAGGSANVETVMNLNNVPGATLSQVSVFQKRRESPNWHRLEGIRFDTLSYDSLTGRYNVRVRGTSRGLGDFALFRSADLTGPTVDFSADGMHFTRGSILPRRPTIYAMLTDVNGIDRSSEHFFAVLDNDTIPNREISWNDTLQDGGGMSALLRPQLEPGPHVLRVIATDNIGNVTQADITFEVRGEFGIEWAINYPNPFSKSTRISYVLTDVTDRPVEVKIYTVSGRRIRTLREFDATVVNYRTFDWDGKDETGDEVANGVYFARIFAKQGDHEVEKTIKMAKLR